MREREGERARDLETTSILISFLRYHIMWCRRNTQPSSLLRGVGSETKCPSAQA